MTDNVFLKKLMDPPLLVEKEHFLVKFAENQAEIEAAMRLRYDVFMAEQGHLSGKEAVNFIDTDEFDPYCLHLIIVERASGDVIGTYRVHPGKVAVENLGFYSAKEFKLEGIDAIAEQTVEVGRSCVKPEYRNGAAVALLWSGLAAVHERTQCHYLLGCVSLTTDDPVIALAVRDFLGTKGDVFTREINAIPQEDYKLPEVDMAAVKAYTEGERKAELRQWVPPLLKGYMRLGAKFGYEPVLDREFGAVDLLVLFNFDEMDQKYVRHFM